MPATPGLQIQIDNQIFFASGVLSLTPVGPVPNAPSNLIIDDGSAPGSISMSWDNNGGADTNEIWRSVNNGSFVLLATVAGVDASYVDSSGLSAPDEYEYKVRGVNANGASAFSNQQGVGRGIGGQNLAAYNYPTMVLHFEDFADTSGVTSANFALLRRVIGGSFDLSGNAGLASLNIDSLASIEGSLFLGNTGLPIFSGPVLFSISGDFQIQNSPNLTSLSAPVLESVGGAFVFSDCPLLATVDVTNLTQVTGGRVDWGNDFSLVTINFPALSTANEIVGSGCLLLTSIGLPFLSTTTHFTVNGCPALLTISVPNIITITGALVIANCPSLTSIDFSQLTEIGAAGPYDVTVVNNPSLVTVNIPLAVFQSFVIIDFSGNALDDTTINMILARGVASATINDTYQLDGGTNSAPTGQGIVDAAALSVDNSVITN